MKSYLIIVLLSLVLATYSVEIRCSKKCEICGDCQFGPDCCNITIIDSGRNCNQYKPPCVYYDTKGKEDIIEGAKEFFSIVNIVLIAIAFSFFTCFVYACCCFDKRKPPVPYSHITESQNDQGY